jgi:choline kinase
MKAVILAAGTGSRFRLGRPVAKGMFDVGGKPLVEHSICQLMSVGVSQIYLVLGECAGAYEPLCKQYVNIVEPIINPFANEGGSLGSFVCAIAHCAWNSGTDPVLCLECDLLYDSRILQSVINDPGSSTIAVTPLRGSGDEVFVEANGRKLTCLSKDRSILEPSNVLGEFVGISKVSPDLANALLNFVELKNPSTPLEYDLDGYRVLSQSHAIACCLVQDSVWGEVDTFNQLDEARDRLFRQISVQ